MEEVTLLVAKTPAVQPETLLYANFAPLNIFFLLSTDKTKVAKVRLFLLIALS